MHEQWYECMRRYNTYMFPFGEMIERKQFSNCVYILLNLNCLMGSYRHERKHPRKDVLA